MRTLLSFFKASTLVDYKVANSGIPFIRTIGEASLALIVSLSLYLPYLSQPTFLDEYDNMIGGSVVARGGAIYQDFYSQHTPLAYWISSIGHVLGLDHFSGQRLWGYFVFASLIAIFYARYMPVFGRIPVAIVVVLVPTFHSSNPDLSYTVLSDNYQAIAVLFTVFELTKFGIFQESKFSHWLTLGLATAFGIGVAFISIYFFTASFLVMLALEIHTSLLRHNSWAIFFKGLALKTSIFAAPSLILVSTIAATSGLKPAYEQAYILNRDVYSKYLGGFGTSALQPIYDSIFTLPNHLKGAFSSFAENPGSAIKEIICIAILLLLVLLISRENLILSISTLLLAGLVSVRGWYGFHGQPIWVFFIGAFALVAWVCQAYLARLTLEPRVRYSSVISSISSILVVGLLVPYGQAFVTHRSWTGPIVSFPHPERSKLIEALVPKGGKYADAGINSTYDFLVTGRLPAGGYSGLVPWLTDMFDQEITDKLKSDNPVLVFHDAKNEVWGQNIDAHAPKLSSYIYSRYTRISLPDQGIMEGVYIRKDSLRESLAVISKTFPNSRIEIEKPAK